MSFAPNIAAAAVAAKMAKMNAANDHSVVQLIEAANANLQQSAKAATPPGLGTSVDISV